MSWLLIVFGVGGYSVTSAEFAKEELCQKAIVEIKEKTRSFSAVCVQKSGITK
jgi:hypothetical protein